MLNHWHIYSEKKTNQQNKLFLVAVNIWALNLFQLFYKNT